MNTYYFNEHEFKKIMNKIATDPYDARLLYEDYLEKYPEDYNAYSFYISTLITIGEIDKAAQVLDYMNKILFNDNKYLSKKDKIAKLEKIYYYTKLKLLIYQKKYQEAYDFCIKYFQFVDFDLEKVLFYLECKLGINEKLDRNNINYAKRQILEYNEDDFLYHIRKHLADFNSDLDEPNKFIFSSDFDVKKIYPEMKKYIPSDKKLLYGLYEEHYFFKYDECGRVNNKLTDYFKIISYYDTSNFITMCPTFRVDNIPYVDLNYLKDNTQSNVKKISQVDKFYKRYQKR